MKKEIFLMCGPTMIADRVRSKMNQPVYSHRTPDYYELHKRVTEKLKLIFNTQEEVIILTSSGTGAMEAAIQNTFSKGDHVVAVVTGFFGQQFADIAKAYGLDVEIVEFPLGSTANVDTVLSHVKEDTKGVLLIHNESSTAIFNDIKAFGIALKDTNALLIVDSISGLGGIEVKKDEWHIDVLLTSSQKALMAPPGLSFISLSEKAWAAAEKSDLPKYYFDLIKARSYSRDHKTVFTPALSNMFALDEALNMILEEGLENLYKRHLYNTKLIHEGVKALGLSLFAEDENFASPTLTTVVAKGKAPQIVNGLKERGIIISGGLPPVADDVFRVGTMGYVSENDIFAFLKQLEIVLKSI